MFMLLHIEKKSWKPLMDFKSRTEIGSEIGSSFRLSPGVTTTRAELTSSVARTTRVRPRAHPAGPFNSHSLSSSCESSTSSNGPRAWGVWSGQDYFPPFGPMRICLSPWATVSKTLSMEFKWCSLLSSWTVSGGCSGLLLFASGGWHAATGASERDLYS